MRADFQLNNQIAQIPNQSEQLTELRERILQIFLVLLLVGGGMLAIINVRTYLQQGRVDFAIYGIIAFLWVLGVTLFKKLPFIVRSGTIIVISYAIGILSYLAYGLQGDGRVWFVFLVSFAVIIAGIRVGIATFFVTLITHFIIGYTITNTPNFFSPDILAFSQQWVGWLTTGITVAFTAGLILGAISVLIQGLSNSLYELQNTLDSERTLTEELAEEHQRLERRSFDLERRVSQIHTAAEISKSLGSILEPEELLLSVVNTIKDQFDLYYAGVFLVDENKRYANLSAGTGSAGQKMIEEGHKLSVGGSSMIGWTVANRKARIAQDVGREAIRFKNPHLPETRSELALPITVGNQALGALTIQSVEPEAFDEDDITVLQGIADSLGIALENARLFQQFESSLREIQQLNRAYLGDAWQTILGEEDRLSYTHETRTIPKSDQANEINIPLTLRDEQVIGNILLEAERTQWTTEEEEFIAAVSNQAALALESARLLEETQRQVEREATLNQLTTKFALSLDFDALLQTVARELGQLPNVVQASIYTAPPAEEDHDQASEPEALNESAVDEAGSEL